MMEEPCEFQEGGERDFPEIADFLARDEYGLQKVAWLEWKYLRNPLGKGRIFVVRDSASKARGMFGIVPCLIHSTKGVPIMATQAVDLFVEPAFRGRRMGQKVLEESTRLIAGPAIGFPNERAKAIMIRLGWHIVGPLERWYFPLNAYYSGINSLLRFHAAVWVRRPKIGLELRAITEFDDKFDGILYNRIPGSSGEFLNWRYIQNPLKSYSCFGFFDSGEQIGYCVMHIERFQAEIYDFFVARKARELFGMVVGFCRDSGVKHLLFRGSRLRIMKYGFFRLRSSRKIIALNLDNKPLSLTLGCSDW